MQTVSVSIAINALPVLLTSLLSIQHCEQDPYGYAMNDDAEEEVTDLDYKSPGRGSLKQRQESDKD